ncbi:DUF1330 domain-containing protein [Pararhodobacter oceanensis]|uniref:DUF1330 domain-containing protein n=1 Tax=Pararhodobacter oceanensis TaxID=2172121 RepID=A0A2T8HW38_9RHOB|nr:DUF1330 domain-containing protein [Pararhodobacter oceanensis]PVH29646.1 DUF1330 domain-containing protein [Pararhodobacter oceanensis]
MPKAYWVAHVDVDDPEIYDRYRAANAVAFAKYGARFLIRGAPQQQIEGKTRARTVVIEFADLETATACFHSPEYQAAKAIRDPISSADTVIVEGYDDA